MARADPRTVARQRALGPCFDVGEIEAAAQRLVDDTVRSIRDRGGQLPMLEGQVRSGHVGSELAELAKDADHMILGCRGYGGFKGFVLGSVSTYVLHHATCPITVIPAA